MASFFNNLITTQLNRTLGRDTVLQNMNIIMSVTRQVFIVIWITENNFSPAITKKERFITISNLSYDRITFKMIQLSKRCINHSKT